MNRGKFNILYYRDERDIQLYLSLKEEKKRLLEQGAYQGEARKRIAVEYGKLLSYSDEAIERYIRQNDEKED